ncbi:MAG TPA: wax ester/triacylglycerol synthase family O-acyltransferase [Acidimicrobiales bacterium]|nr:wax ester/triacylglycerol synthase family O-acyltransferase [Acidimicrobiales bacterium]
MEQLSGLDAAFLYLETPSLHMHVSMAALFDPTTVPGGYSFEKLRDLVSSRLALAPIFRRRLVEVPFRLGHPYWVDDPSFDIDYHIRRCAVPAPGGIDELAQFVGDVCSRQLDRTKPLWEMYIVEGLRGGRVAMVTKIHHCTIDGVSGSELLAQLFDLEPAPGASGSEPAPATGEGQLPSELQLVARSLLTRAIRPFGITKLAWRTGKALMDVRRVRAQGTGRAALPLTAPRTSLNAAITPHRKVAFSSIALDDAKRVKRACGTTVNDVVLAVCTGALRRYLRDRHELPDGPLVATVPVSVAPTLGNRRGANKVSAMFVALPCQIDDPLERLRAIREGTKGAKEEHNALGANVLLDWVEHATPNVFSAAARAYTRLKLADRHRPIHSLVISNVPGPDFPLYLAGAELVAGFPLGPVMDGAALNITVMSYRTVLNWGLMACAETVPQVAELARLVPEALEELLAAAGLEPATPVGVAPGRARRRRAVSARARAGAAGA